MLQIDILDGSDNKQGSGPITSASVWRYTARMDKSGSFSFELPASDPKAITITKKRRARAYATMNGQRVEVGYGIIDKIERRPMPDGTVVLRVSGNDALRELTYRSVFDLKLYTGGNPVSHATAVAAVAAYAPAGWTITPDGAPPNDSIYGRFGGETVLAGLIKIAEKSQNHFYRGSGKSINFASAFSPSGVRAIQARGDLTPNTCAITALSEQIETYDLLTRIHPKGSGNADVQLTLRATTRSAPSGYTLNAAQNYIENDAATAAYGRIEREVAFRDIGPIENTGADIQAAANMLFDAALETLKRHSVELEQATYTLQIAGCSQLLRPMQSIRLVYKNTVSGLDINTDLNILESTWQVDRTGVYTTDLVVSNADRWPKNNTSTVVDSIVQGNIYQALPQLNASVFALSYTKHVDHDELAAFRFRMGNEITQLQQVLFEAQLLPFESTVKSVAGSTTTSSSGGGSSQSASSGGSHIHSVTVPGHSHAVTIAQHSHTVTVAGHSHSVTIPGHSHTVTIAGHSHSITIPAHSHTVTIPGHAHNIPIYDLSAASPSMKQLFLDISSELLAVSLSNTGNIEYVSSTESNSTVNNSSDEEATVANSSSPQSQTTPTSDVKSDTVQSSSPQSQTTPTSSIQSQTTPSSDTSSQIVQTSSSNGTHAHTVTIPSHTHTLTPLISMIYGIFRADVDDTYEASELEYRVNGGSWMSLDTAVDAGDGWLQLDITDDVQDATTFRPLQENNLLEIRAKQAGSISIGSWSLNAGFLAVTTLTPHGLVDGDSITISGAPLGSGGTDINGDYTDVIVSSDSLFGVPRAGSDSGGSGGTVARHQTATIDAQLSVRSIIQAVAYN